jgi:DNA mismatch endonuclease, patch repair protein
MAKSPRYAGLTPASSSASRAKSRNRAEGTRPERALRRALFARGHRYRLHLRSLPGRPDLVFPRRRLVVFVDGDFWHGRNWSERRHRLAAGSNAAYWLEKIPYNMARDRSVTAQLQAAGWRVLRLWETDVRKDLDGCLARIEALLEAWELARCRDAHLCASVTQDVPAAKA